MNITQKQKNFIEKIIKESSVYRGNEYLFDEFFNEVIRRAYSLVSKQDELENIRVYLKRIVNSAIVEVIKNQVKNSYSNKTDTKEYEQESLNLGYEFDENSDIELDYDISSDEPSRKPVCLSESQINQIKKIIYNLDEKNNSDFYKNIFELRYLKGLNNNKISEKLKIEELEVDKKLLYMLSNIRKEGFAFK